MIRVLDFESPAYTLFEGLDYFPTDPEYRVEGTIQPYDEPEAIKIVDTVGFVSDAWVYGMVEFTLKGKPLQLKMVLFTPDPTPDSRFYVMFGDKTNGRETYGAGRYLLPNFVPSGSITLDFNRSVNPSCAYNSGFACPRLAIASLSPFPQGSRTTRTVPLVNGNSQWLAVALLLSMRVDSRACKDRLPPCGHFPERLVFVANVAVILTAN